MRRRTAQEWANYWRARCESAEDRYTVLRESVTTYLDAWERFTYISEFQDEFFEAHYDSALVTARRNLEAALAATEGSE